MIKMNKIILEQEELLLADEKIIIDKIKTSKINIYVSGIVECGILRMDDNIKVNIYLKKNARLTMDLFVFLQGIKNEFNIYSEDNTEFNLNYACKYKNSNYIKINNYVKGSNASINTLIRAVEIDGVLEIEANGNILESKREITYLEDIKALINNNNSIKISPNLKVESNLVEANHNATISNVREEDLFYLESKGINKEDARYLIKKGFLKRILQIKEIQEVMQNE